MKEKGIIMSGDHPAKVLDGTKTMTRRVIKPQPELTGGMSTDRLDEDAWYWKGGKALLKATYGADYVHTSRYYMERAMLTVCPFGQVGDRLWVRETWVPAFHGLDCLYKADEWIGPFPFTGKWKPSIHMPRWASRINLEITEVRVERVQDISFNDMLAEGVRRSVYDIELPNKENASQTIDNSIQVTSRNLWDSLNAKRGYGWDMNPWVWVIGFKVIK